MKVIVDGNKACSDVSYLFSEVACIYPITPSSPMASEVDKLANEKRKENIFKEQVKLVEMQSEAGAAGAMHGALVSGGLATTYTASQGLLLMIPNMYKIAGEGLPGVIHVAARTVATHALSIFGDHSDIYAARSTGFCMLASTNVFDAQNLAAVAHLSAISSSLPFLHFFDGFRTSHELNTIEKIDEKKLLKLVDHKRIDEFKKRALNYGCNYQMGMAENEDIYFQSVEARNLDYERVPDIVNLYMEKINEMMGTAYKPFQYYGKNSAKYVVVAMGSVCDSLKILVDNNKDYGLIEVHLFRPFSKKYLLDVLPKSVKRIAVLDRAKEAGSNGEALYLDVLSALSMTDIRVVGGRYGLASKNTTLGDLAAVYEMLEKKLRNNFTIGIVDDVTNLSLNSLDVDYKVNAKELLIYGFGSDGLVSASKDMMKIIGNNTSSYVQAYFEYDSKKSGGVTISHLRISDKLIQAPFYVESPEILVISKDNYLRSFDMFKKIKRGAIVLINTSKDEKEFADFLPNNVKKIINEKELKVLVIDAEKIARDAKIKGKISKIIEVILMKLLKIENAKELVEKSIKEQFKSKGEDVVKANLLALDKALNGLKIFKSNFSVNDFEDDIKDCNVFDLINQRKGNSLKVSEVLPFKNGRFPSALSRNEKRATSVLVPKWVKENCIGCGFCSIVCPHAAIRVFAVKNQDNSIPLAGSKEYNYQVLVSEADCLSCGLCLDVCPGKSGKKALVYKNRTLDTQDYVTKMFETYENPSIFDKFQVKGSQFEKPRFEFSGACQGCGETPYLKLLTQLFQDKMVIANATGCSSIYGGSAPSTPYSIPWANSLFEDNAEFGYGMYLTYKVMKERIKRIINETKNKVDKEVLKLYKKYLNNSDDYEITKEIKEVLEKKKIPKELKNIINYMVARKVFMIGGDGWAYDIGYSGIDHILSSGEDVKIIVLDTEVYSNTGGQMSKSSHIGQVGEFADLGKRTPKKDLFRMAMNYPNCYVGSVSLGANFMQTIKTFKEAEEHKGPSIVICYSPCIEQGIKGGMCNALKEQKLAVECGYVTLMRYNPETSQLFIDSKEPDFNKYKDFLMNEVRYRSLVTKDSKLAKELLALNIKWAKKRYEEYKKIMDIKAITVEK